MIHSKTTLKLHAYFLERINSMPLLPPHISRNYGYILPLPIKLPYYEKWYVPVTGVPGRYLLYTSNTVSKSFDNDLISLGYDWFFPSYESAMTALEIYRNQGQPQFDAFYTDHNSAVVDAIEHSPATDTVLLEPEVIFLEPRPHAYLHNKWIVTTQSHPFSISDSLYTDGSVGPSNDGLLPSRLFDTEEEALAALTAYRAKYRPTTLAPVEPIPLRPISERINFLPPRRHISYTSQYVVCAQSQSPYRQYLGNDLSVTHSEGYGMFNSIEQAQQALDAYNALFEPAPVAQPIPNQYPPLEGIFKFQLPAFNHRLEQYYIPSLSGNEYLHKNLTVHKSTGLGNGYYDTYDQALFAKLRYERMNR